MEFHGLERMSDADQNFVPGPLGTAQSFQTPNKLRSKAIQVLNFASHYKTLLI